MKQQDFTTARQHMKTVLRLLSILSVACFPALADQNSSAEATAAAPSMQDLPSYAKGTGHGIGFSEDAKARVHLGLDMGIGFNTNPYSLSAQEQQKLTTSRGQPDLIVKLRPAFLLNAPGRMMALEVGVGADTGALPDVTGGFGSNWNWMLFNGRARGQMEINKDGAVSFFIGDLLTGSKKPAELFVSNLFNIHNDVGAGVRIKPAGSTVNVQLDGTYGFDYWPGKDFIVASANPEGLTLDSENVYGHLRVDWHFTPKGSFFVDAKGGRYTLLQEPTTRSYPLWTAIGVNGELTKRLSGSISAGYANPFTVVVATNQLLDPGISGLTGQASLSWNFAQDASFSVGYMRNIAPSPTFLNVATNSAYASYVQQFGKKITLSIAPMVNHLYFGLPLDGNVLRSGSHRQDIGLDMRAEVIYYVRNWFGIGFSNQTNLRWTNAAVADIASPAGQVDGEKGYDILFTRNESLFVMSFNY